MNIKIDQIRKEYSRKKLSISDTVSNPFEQFESWLREAIEAEVPEPTAMCLSTANESGHPTSRMVLLKGISEGKFIFFTNYTSQKSQELDKNPYCSLTFYWPALERQVNITGTSERISELQSDAYFKTRPWSSQIGAWVSPQSQIIKSRIILLRDFINISAKYLGREIPRPTFWGGIAVAPNQISFWQGRQSRLHDRIQFSLNQNGTWDKARIAP